MTFGPLTPTLATIERDLFGVDDAGQGSDSAHDADAVGAPVEMGPALRAMIARRAAAAQGSAATDASAPALGDMWWLRLDGDSSAAILIREVTPQRVQGWLVAGESAYAADRDWVLQEDEVEGALDPRAAMVQLWNSVAVARDRLESPVGRMTEQAFHDLVQVAQAPAVDNGSGPVPGRVGLVETAGVAWVSGTPLGESDPRRSYQEIYARLAATIALRPAASPKVGPVADASLPGNVVDLGARRDKRRSWLNGDFWRGAGIAAALVLAVGVPFTRMQQQAGSGDEGASAQWRGIPTSGKTVLFDVHFSGSATLDAMTAFLQASHMNLVSGPAGDGAYVVAVKAADAAQARKTLDGSGLVVVWTERKH